MFRFISFIKQNFFLFQYINKITQRIYPRQIEIDFTNLEHMQHLSDLYKTCFAENEKLKTEKQDILDDFGRLHEMLISNTEEYNEQVKENQRLVNIIKSEQSKNIKIIEDYNTQIYKLRKELTTRNGGTKYKKKKYTRKYRKYSIKNNVKR